MNSYIYLLVGIAIGVLTSFLIFTVVILDSTFRKCRRQWRFIVSNKLSQKYDDWIYESKKLKENLEV